MMIRPTHVAALTAVMLALALLASTAHANILTNGDFETGDLTDWRFFDTDGGTSSATVEAASANSGSFGVTLVRDGSGDSAVDKDTVALRESIPTEERIYRLLVDATDAGLGATEFRSQFQFTGGSGFNNRVFTFDPGPTYDTVGMTTRSNAAGDLSVRFNLGLNESARFDNVRVVDVTDNGNRVINGGFENGLNPDLRNWRFFAVGGATGSIGFTGDTNSGDQAVLLERTNTAGDSALDLDQSDLRIATLGGEDLHASFYAKQDSGDADARINVNIAAFDDTGAFLTSLASELFAPGSSEYEQFSLDFTTTASTAYVSIAFRVVDSAGDSDIGGYKIDDVFVGAIPAPAALPAGIVMLTVLAARHRR